MKTLDLEEAPQATRDALKGADLSLLAEWMEPLAPIGVGFFFVGEKVQETEKRHAKYESIGYVFAWPPRARCRRCGKPSCWTHHELGADHPWLCTDQGV